MIPALPQLKILPFKQRLQAACGAFLGLSVSSWLSYLLLGDFNAWYIAPMGASSVLLFALPASPLAQPWNIVVGNTLAALLGVACALWIPNSTEAFSVAAALAIFFMLSTDSLHPPSGAVALTAVLGGPSVRELGFAFALYPVLLNSLLLLAIALLFHRLCGQHYPNLAQGSHGTQNPTPTAKVSIQNQDIQLALQQQTKLLDISDYDLAEIIVAAQQSAQARQQPLICCADLMSRQVISLDSDDDICHALAKFKQVNLMSLPVLNAQQHLVGTLAMYQIVEWFEQATEPRMAWQSKVEHIMQREVVTVRPEQALNAVIPYFVERSFNYMPVVEQQRLVGIISRADVIAWLYAQHQAK